MWNHGPFPLTGYNHVTELGCGTAMNLIAMAYFNRETTFLGIDYSEVSIEIATSIKNKLDLTNIRFLARDIRGLKPSLLPKSDYVIVHGLYSWVPEDVRNAILLFCVDNLKHEGLAYISYNAKPGWFTRNLVRETLLRSSRVHEAPDDKKGEAAKEEARRLLLDLPSKEYASAVLLANELERVIQGKDWYVFHEYLAEFNQGFWLREFVENAKVLGLRYVADAQFCRPEGQVPSALKTSLSKSGLNTVEQEENADLLCHRHFHASILCRSDAPRTNGTREEVIEKAYIAAFLRPLSDPFYLDDGSPESFQDVNGYEVTVDASMTKAAILILADQWPRGMKVDVLFARVSKLLATYGFNANLDAREFFVRDFIILLEAGFVHCRFEEPEFDSRIPSYPKLNMLSRHEITNGQALSTPFAIPFVLNSDAMEIVNTLDGKKSINELQNIWGEDVVTEAIESVSRWGLLEHSDS